MAVTDDSERWRRAITEALMAPGIRSSSTPPLSALGYYSYPPLAPPLRRSNALDGVVGLGDGYSTAARSVGLGLAPPLPVRVPENPKTRKVFFSFHYDDIMRVNNVRLSQEFIDEQSVRPFNDRSLWETAKRNNPEGLKRLIREGMQNSSVLCVLVGTETWARRWVHYEIARSVIDGKGLVAVHINGLNHHRDRHPHARGTNPLNIMSVGKMADGTFRLFLLTVRGWERYPDYMGPVPLPKYLREPAVGYVTALNIGTREYDFAAMNGAKNLGGWLDLAAAEAGR